MLAIRFIIKVRHSGRHTECACYIVVGIFFSGQARIVPDNRSSHFPTLAIILVDEAIDIAKLQFDRGAHVVESYHLAEISNDLQAAFETAPVVVGKLKDEKIFKQKIL